MKQIKRIILISLMALMTITVMPITKNVIVAEDEGEFVIDADATNVGGTVTVDKQKANPEEIITVTVTPQTGYRLSELYYFLTGVSGNNTPITKDEQGNYTFVMPEADVSVRGSFELLPTPTVRWEKDTDNLPIPVLKWNAVEGASSYVVSLQHEHESESAVVIDNVNTLTYDLTEKVNEMLRNCDDNYTYFFGSVQAVFEDGISYPGRDPNDLKMCKITPACIDEKYMGVSDEIATISLNPESSNNWYVKDKRITATVDIKSTEYELIDFYNQSNRKITDIDEQAAQQGNSITFGAKWEIINIVAQVKNTASHTITFKQNGGSGMDDADLIQIVGAGEETKEPDSVPFRKGYSFKGWYLGEDLFEFGEPLTNNITLYAHWEEITPVTVTLNVGSGHTELADEIDNLITKYESEVSEDKTEVSIKFSSDEDKDDVVDYLKELLFQISGGKSTYSHKNEILYLSIPVVEKSLNYYDSYGSVAEEYMSYDELPIKGWEINLLWLQPVTKAVLTVEPLNCGDEVIVTKQSSPSIYREYYIQTPIPSLSVSDSSQIGAADIYSSGMSFWLKSANIENIEDIVNHNNWFSGVANETVATDRVIYAKFPYIFKESDDVATINGKKAAIKVFDMLDMSGSHAVVPIGGHSGSNYEPVEEPLIVMPGNPYSEEIPEAYVAPKAVVIGEVEVKHNWEFKGFTWSNSNTKATANYVCKENEEHTKTVDAEVSTETYRTVATVTEDNSPDGVAHSDEIAIYWNLYVQGVHVNGGNYKDILKDGGSVSYDPESNILSLNNATIEAERRDYGDDSYEYGIRVNLPDADVGRESGPSVNKILTIRLSGTNTIKNTETKEDTKRITGLEIFQQKEVIFTGGGTLNIEMNANNSNVPMYRGIFRNFKTTINNAIININIPGNQPTEGFYMNWSNVLSLENKAEMHISVGNNSNTFAFNNNRGLNEDLEVGADCTFEAKSNNKALNNLKITDSTKALGAFVNTEASNEGVETWDGSADLNKYKYVYIPGTYRFKNISGNGLTWYKGNSVGATFEFESNVNDNETCNKYLEGFVDGKKLKDTDQDIESGSLILTLKPSYLNSLNAGEHTLRVLFNMGADIQPYPVEVKFYVRERSSGGGSYVIPKTGIE